MKHETNDQQGFNRRIFLAGSAGLMATMAVHPSEAAPSLAALATSNPSNCAAVFPKDFIWGTATSCYQVEGAAREDGRMPSVWDTFSQISGRVKNNDTGDVACDHYHRFREDVKLMADLGIKHYRFSIAWPRVIPEGRGTVNEKGIDFYSRLVDTLLEHGITPHATLYHWDTPQALEDLYGSWRSREIASDFADYCAVTVKRLGDRITDWMTMNEILCFTYTSYGLNTIPETAPGVIVKSQKDIQQTVHHALLAHGMACKAIRATTSKPCKVSLVVNFDAYVPLVETPVNIEACKRAFVAEHHNGTVLVPALTGKYNPLVMESLGAEAPDIQSGDMETIGQSLDFLGFNVYTGSYVRAADNPRGYEVLPMPKAYPKMIVDWINFLPESLYWGVRLISDALGKKTLPIYITENGCATDDEATDRSEVFDLARIMYMRSYLRSAHRAIIEGYPLKGYFHWSLMDNFEWAEGYTRRFGLTYVDYQTQKRIPKQSFRWYQEVIRQNQVL